MNEVIEGEVRDVTVVAPTPPALFGTSDPVEIVAKARDVANALKDVLRQQGLISDIQGKEYVQVGGWTLLGSMLGVFPVLVWTRALDGNGWEARVEARTMGGVVVGAAEAECTRDEKMWASREDYALRSMAQTRATSKALRMPLGFVVTLAGFSATPAEEMTFSDRPFDQRPQRPPQSDVPQIAPPSCPDHGVCKYIKGGTSKASGKPYEAFYTCPNKDCTRGSKGKGFYVNADDWKQNTRNLNQPVTEAADFDELPYEEDFDGFAV